MVFDAYKMSNLHIDPCGGDEGPSVLPEQGKPSTNSRSNVNPSMHVRRTAEMLNHVGTFQLPRVPDPVVAYIKILVQRHGQLIDASTSSADIRSQDCRALPATM
jgi:hypothetical protein